MTDLPHPVDQFVGTRLRLRRLEKGLSQKQLAKALDLSFQQVQKYEKGKNRISASMLFEIAGVLEVPILYFFDGLEPDAKREEESIPSVESVNMMGTREGLRFVRAFFSVKDRKIRKLILRLVEEIADANK